MDRLEDAVADYNKVRRALCASKAGATSHVQIRAESCGLALHPSRSRTSVTYMEVARRSDVAGEHIVGLWDAVCAEARRLERDPDAMVCPME